MSKPSPWEISADEVLAVILRSNDEWSRARFELGLKPQHMPPGPWRDLFDAVDALRLSEQPVHIAGLMDVITGSVTAEWISQRMVVYSDAMLGMRFADNVRIVKTRAIDHAHQRAMAWGAQAIQDAKEETERREVVARVITMLGQGVVSETRTATAAAIGERFDDLMEDNPPPIISTGIDWLDNATGGFQRKQIWWLAAAYKKRKSTVARNIIIGALRNGATVTLGAREGDQQVWASQFVAMLAVEWLWKQGHYGKSDGRGFPLHLISGPMLMRLRNRYKTQLHPLQVHSISEGSKEFKAWGERLRIYDTSQHDGALSNIDSVFTMVRRDQKMYGVDLVVLDYLQLFGEDNASTYENVSRMARQLQQCAASEDLAMFVLAQLNEESVKGHNKSHSPGVKGGGDPAATADFLLTSDYAMDHEGEPMTDTLRLTIKLARHGESGKWKEYNIHEASGLILPQREIDFAQHSGGAS